MKFKVIFSIFSLIGLFGVCACSNQGGIIIDNEDSDISQTPNDSNNQNNADFSNVSINYNRTASSSSTSIEDTVDAIYDSVVAINVAGISDGQSFTAAGSGVLFAYDEEISLSYVVTCFHVIENASTIEVVLSDEKVYEASYVGGYSDGDIAVISIEALDLTYASIYENSDNLRLGSTVICIGNPLGTLPGSVSTGVVSYNNRVINVSTYEKMTLIQTDVAINSGNSGGGLFNSAGALIGIVNAKYSKSGVEGLGFAIPSNQVMDIIDSISSTATYSSESKLWEAGYLVGDFEFAFTLADGYYSTGGWPNINRKQVVYVSSLLSNETATGYNLLNVNDIVTSLTIDYKDEAVEDVSLTNITSSSVVLTSLYSTELKIGDTLSFGITRDDNTITVSFTITQYIYAI